jgi:hypothetical protein
VPLWAVVLAVQLVDLAWAILVLGGVERVRIDASLPSNPLDLYYIPFSHGLPTTALLGCAVFLAARAWLRAAGPALALALAAASHWFLDLIVHRPDLPLWGNSHHVGLALWNHPVAALLVELALLLGCAAVLLRSTALPRPCRTTFFWYLAGLVAVHVVFSLAPPPPGPAALASSAMVFFLVAVWLARRVEASA